MSVNDEFKRFITTLAYSGYNFTDSQKNHIETFTRLETSNSNNTILTQIMQSFVNETPDCYEKRKMQAVLNSSCIS